MMNEQYVYEPGGFFTSGRVFNAEELKKIKTIQFAGSCCDEINLYETNTGEIIRGYEKYFNTTYTSGSSY